MPYDSNLVLTGTGASPRVDITATTNYTGVNCGDNRSFVAKLLLGGDVRGSGPTLDAVIATSETVSGSYTTRATFTQVTDEMVGYIATSTARPEVPGEQILAVGFHTPDGEPFVRVTATIGGSGTAFDSFAVVLEPLPNVGRQGVNFVNATI